MPKPNAVEPKTSLVKKKKKGYSNTDKIQMYIISFTKIKILGIHVICFGRKYCDGEHQGRFMFNGQKQRGTN